MAIEDLRAIMPGASALIRAIGDELGVARIVDERVRWDEQPCKLSPGTRIVAMIVNALVHRTPLYQVEEFYAGQDVALLFGPGVSAQDFNDDALARALDALAEAEPRTLFTQLALRAVLRDRIPVKTLHADTTSRRSTAPTRATPPRRCTSPTATAKSTGPTSSSSFSVWSPTWRAFPWPPPWKTAI